MRVGEGGGVFLCICACWLRGGGREEWRVHESGCFWKVDGLVDLTEGSWGGGGIMCLLGGHIDARCRQRARVCVRWFAQPCEEAEKSNLCNPLQAPRLIAYATMICLGPALAPFLLWACLL